MINRFTTQMNRRERSFCVVLSRSLIPSFILMSILATCCANAASLYLPQDAISLERNRDLRAILSWLDQQRGTIIAMQRELVALQALNPEHGGIGEERKLQWVEARLRDFGVTDQERLDYTDARVPGKVRGNLIAKLHGNNNTQEHRRTLWLITHLDVFPPGQANEWSGDPFTLRVEGDRIYGRGTEDNNQGIVTSLLLANALRVTNVVPELDIGLLFCSGGLTTYSINIEHVLHKKPGLFSPDDLILLLDYGSESGGFIEVAEKSNIWLKFTVTGKEGHASSPHESVNALAAGVEFMHALRRLDAVFPTENPLFSPPKSTFTPTFVENFSKATNHIPGVFVFYVDARLNPEYSFADLEKAMRDLSGEVGTAEGARIEYEVIEHTPNTAVTPADAPVVRLLGRAIEEQLGVKPELGGIGGVTMASAIRAAGLPVVAWGILKNWRNKAEEYASLTGHVNQAKVLARLLIEAEADALVPAGAAGEGDQNHDR